VKIKKKKDKKEKKEKKEKKSVSAKKSPRITKTFRSDSGIKEPLGGRRRKRTIKRRVRIGGTSGHQNQRS